MTTHLQLKKCRNIRSRIPFEVHPTLETLEDRVTPSASPLAPQFLIGEVTGAEAGPPAVVVVNATGDFVATWESLETDGSGIGIYAQRFNADGTANGSSVRVNTTTAGNQSRPAIATDGAGNVVIAWQSESASGGAYDIYYTTGDFAGGTDWLSASETRVNVVTTANQINPTVAMDANGNFVIGWQSDQETLTNGFDVYGRSGTLLSGLLGTVDHAIAVGVGDQVNPDVAMVATDSPSSGDGRIIAAWTGPGPVGSEGEATNVVRGTLYTYNSAFTSIDPVALHTDYQLTAVAQHDQVNPDVGMASNGSFVLVWQAEGEQGSGSDVFSQRFDVNGDGIEATNILVNAVTQQPQRNPVIAVDKDGKYFVLWQSQGADERSWGIVGKAFTAAGVAQPAGDFLVNVNEQGPQTNPAVAVSPDGQTVAVWAGPFVPSHGGDEEGVEGEGGHQPALFARRFTSTGTVDVTPSMAALNVNGLEFQLATVGAGEDVPASATALTDGTYVVVWQAFEEAQDPSGFGVYGQRVAADGTLIGAKFLINQTTLGYQSHPSVTALPGGGFVVVWQSEIQAATPDVPPNYDIFARVYTVAGPNTLVPGNEFLINTNTTTGQQTRPQVASDAQGNFVVVWQTDAQTIEEVGTEIYARRYSVSGTTATPVADEFRVNTVTAATLTPPTGQAQFSPVVAMNAAGQFAVAWVSDHNVANDPTDTEKSIFVRWFDANGVAPNPEFLANVYTKDAQEHPAIGINEVGTMVVAWQSINQETGGTGVSWGVFARQFYPNGTSPQTQEFQVNQTVASPQRFPEVTVNEHGYFTIAWQTINQDASSWAVFERQYNPEGVAQTNETIVNTVTSGPQILPVFARQPNGTYLAAWSGTAAEHIDGVAGRIYQWQCDDPTGNYIRELYHDILGRDAEPAGLDGWRSYLVTHGAEAVVLGIWNSQEHRILQVAQLYRDILDREPDSGGLVSWVGLMQSGWSYEQVLVSFLTSPEHQAQHPDLGAYIAELYEDVLGRAASPAEVQAWVDWPLSGSPTNLAWAFLNSSESHQRWADSAYSDYLQREPDSGGFESWTNMLNSGLLGHDSLAIAFLGSAENQSAC